MERYIPRIRVRAGRRELFDRLRRQFVALTPEELVRQQLIHFLISEKHFPEGLLGVEVAMRYNHRPCRADLVAYNRQGQPLLLVECKAPDVTISRAVFEQIAHYNLVLKVPFLLVSNGRQHFFCRLLADRNTFRFEAEMPDYEQMQT